MKTQRSFGNVLLAIGIFLLTNCEKETVAIQQQDQREGIFVENFSGLALSGEPIVDYQLGAAVSQRREALVRGKPLEDAIIELRARSITKPRTRPRQSDGTSEQLGCSIEYFVQCGDLLQSNTDEDYQTNFASETYDNSHYERFNLMTDLNGYEKVFYFKLNEEKLVTFQLTQARQNLAMLLFKAVDGIDQLCETDGVREFAREQAEKLVAYSTSSSSHYENLGPVRLKPGLYFLVIDSRPGKGSSFNLEVSCQAIHQVCDDQGLYYDNFANYSAGAVSNQSVFWEKYYPQATYDANVVCCAGGGLGPVLEVARKASANSADQPNVFLCLGERNTGRYSLTFKLGIPRGYSGYFSIQKELTEQHLNDVTGAKLLFSSSGIGTIQVGNQRKKFNYHNGYWADIRLDFDIDAGEVAFYINDSLVHQWYMQGIAKLEALNFYPRYSNSVYYLDRFCFSKVN